MLCHQLEALRGKADLSYKQLANLCNVSETTISRICSGETTDPSFSTVSSIVAACEGSLDEIAGLRQPSEQKSSFEIMADKYEARLSENKQSAESRIASTKESYERRIMQLNESHDRQVAQLTESHDRQVKQLTESSERRIKELTESNEQRIKELNDGFERRNRELNDNFERRIAENLAREEKRIAEAEEREKRANYHFYAMAFIIAIMLAAIFYLIMDAMHGNWGIFQYQELLNSVHSTASLPSLSDAFPRGV